MVAPYIKKKSPFIFLQNKKAQSPIDFRLFVQVHRLPCLLDYLTSRYVQIHSLYQLSVNQL